MRVALRLFAATLLCTAITASGQPAPPVNEVTPPPPITRYVDRFLDSAYTPNLEQPVRTLRAMPAKAAPELDRVFMIFGGGTFAAYRASTFTQRLAEPRTRVLGRTTEGETYLQPEMTFNAETAGWVTPSSNVHRQLWAFDWDDRGNVYLAYLAFGWGIINAEGQSIVQVTGNGFSPYRVQTLKVGSSYYALLNDGSPTTRVYDVTNPAAPALVRELPFAVHQMARSNGPVAVILGSELRIYEPAELINAGSYQSAAFPSQLLNDITTDGTRFYTITSNGDAMRVFEVTPAAEVAQLHGVRANGFSIRYGTGMLAVAAESPSLPPNLFGLVLRRESGEWRAHNVSSYFEQIYPSFPPRVLMQSLTPVATADGTFLIASMFGLGEVFQLQSSATEPPPRRRAVSH